MVVEEPNETGHPARADRARSEPRRRRDHNQTNRTYEWKADDGSTSVKIEEKIYLTSQIPSKGPPPAKQRKRTLSFGTVLPTKPFQSELVRCYKDNRDYQPNTLRWLKTSASSWFDVPFRRTSWSRTSMRAKINL